MGFVEYRAQGTEMAASTQPVKLSAGTPHDITLDRLRKDQQYLSHWVWRPTGAADAVRSPQYRFHTQRAAGKPFTFTVQADSHLDENTSGEVYLRTLANALADEPDFHFELGDTFMTGKYVRPELALGQYLA